MNRFVLWMLKHSNLSLAERNELIIHILDKLEALPLRDIISSSDEGILINGKPADIEKLRLLRDSANAAIENYALNYIGEQVMWVATERLTKKITTPEELFFYRAALWFGEQLKAHLKILAGYQESPLSEN